MSFWRGKGHGLRKLRWGREGVLEVKFFLQEQGQAGGIRRDRQTQSLRQQGEHMVDRMMGRSGLAREGAEALVWQR